MSHVASARHARPSTRRRLVPAPAPGVKGAWSPRTAGGLVAALYLAASLVIWIPLLKAGIGSAIHTGGDTYLNLNLLGWVPRALGHGQNPFLDPLLNHPGGLNLLVNTSQPLLGVLLWPITAAFGPAVSLNLAVIASMPLTAVTSYVLIRQFVQWRPAAFVGGAIVGFGPYEFQSAAHFHLQLSVTFLIPLIFTVLVWLGRGQVSRSRGAAMLFALVIAQFFTSTELLLTALLVAALAGGVSLALSTTARAHLRSSLSATAIAGGAAAVVLAWPIWFLLRGPGSIRGPVQLVAQAYRTDLLALVIPPEGLALAPASLTKLTKGFSTLPGENVAYLGVPLVLAAVAIVIWRRSERRVLIAGAMTFVTFVLGLGGSLTVTGKPAIGPDGAASGSLWLPEALLGELPMVKNLIPSRFALYTAIFVAILLAIGADRLLAVLAERRGRQGVALVAVALAIVAVPLIPLDPVHKEFHRLSSIPSYFSSPAYRSHPSGDSTVVLPYPADPQPVAILWQAQAGYRLAMPSGHAKMPEGADHHVAYNTQMGYATNSAMGQFGAALNHGRAIEHTPANRAAILADLEQWGTGSVSASLDWIKRPAAARAELRWLLGESTGKVGRTLYWNSPFRGGTSR